MKQIAKKKQVEREKLKKFQCVIGLCSHKTSMSESQSLLAEMDALKGVQGKELNILSEQV